jgi:hypothetical protein
MLALIALSLGQGFFDKPDVDFWGTRRLKPAAPAASVFEETVTLPDGRAARWTPPAEVLRLLDDPSPQNARAYLEIQAERMKRIRRAMEAVRAAGRPPVIVYSLPGCPACERQRAELQEVPWTVRFLPPPDSVTRVPTIVIGERVLVGFHTKKQIEEVFRD